MTAETILYEWQELINSGVDSSGATDWAATAMADNTVNVRAPVWDARVYRDAYPWSRVCPLAFGPKKIEYEKQRKLEREPRSADEFNRMCHDEEIHYK